SGPRLRSHPAPRYPGESQGPHRRHPRKGFSELSVALCRFNMVVEPLARDSLAENLNPVGRVYYAFSTMVCTPGSLSHEVGLALGAQAGERRLRDVLSKGGFTRVRRAAETPFNMILEARP